MILAVTGAPEKLVNLGSTSERYWRQESSDVVKSLLLRIVSARSMNALSLRDQMTPQVSRRLGHNVESVIEGDSVLSP